MCAMSQGMSIKLPARSRSGELSFCLGASRAHKIVTFPDPDGKRIKFRIAASDCVEHFAMLHRLTCCRPWITFTFSITLPDEFEEDYSWTSRTFLAELLNNVIKHRSLGTHPVVSGSVTTRFRLFDLFKLKLSDLLWIKIFLSSWRGLLRNGFRRQACTFI